MRQPDVGRRYATVRMRCAGERDRRPANVYVGVMIHRIGSLGDLVDQANTVGEAGRLHATADAGGVALPAVEFGEGLVEFGIAQKFGHTATVARAGGPRQGRRLAWLAAMTTHVQIVVGAAILDAGRVLAARRIGPPALAGKWELPGGKVDPGETDEAALVRECREELGVDVLLGRRVGRDWAIGEHGLLRIWLATIARGEPELRDHSEFRWLTVDELHDVDWLPADLPIIEKLASLLLDLATPDDENARS